MSDIQRIDGRTPDLTEENVDKLVALFPDVLTEVTDQQTGETKKAIDFDALRDKLGDVAENTRERYQFTWPGKRAAKAEARKPIAKTLRPVKERSKDWDTTQNLYIEGDNLDALKILRETYAGKIKLIYIDPSYNTGHDFIYKDNFGKTVAAGKAESGDYDDDGGQLVVNPESNGRFHSDWCSMIYPRLLLARDLLASDGVIFISIDENESANLKKICDEVFGNECFVNNVIWRSSDNSNNDAKQFSNDYNDILIYSKKPGWQPNRLQDPEKRRHFKNPDNDPRGAWFDGNPLNSPNYRENLRYEIVAPNGNIIKPPANGWRWSKETLDQKMKSGEIYFNEKQTNIKRRTYLADMKGLPPSSLWTDLDQTGHNRQAKYELLQLIDDDVFDTPKPVKLLSFILSLIPSSENSIVLDFFGGSSTTADAVMRQNAVDGQSRSYILVQIPENLDESIKSARNDSKKGIESAIRFCDSTNNPHELSIIGEERIRRAGEKIKAEVEAENAQGKLDGELKKVPDIGFRVLRVDSSCYEDVRKTPAEVEQGALDLDEDNTKEGRSSLDLLFECLPTFQLPYTSSIDVLSGEPFDGYTVCSVNGGQLLACFDKDIPESLIRGMADFDPKPSYVVVAEKSLPDSAACTNFAEIFKQSANALEGQTQIRII
ncbi:site-specific DNA-methyltransferase [Bifidobacterium bifidum]|uniref:site-specific DNA-methyltransferase n=1 Tax=Bifidobacterium bifidum TaxID=1681 RepID=UPI003CFF5BCA